MMMRMGMLMSDLKIWVHGGNFCLTGAVLRCIMLVIALMALFFLTFDSGLDPRTIPWY